MEKENMVANRINTLTEELIENLAAEIREFLIAEEMWQDVTIYFNRKAFSTYDKMNGKYYYNDREHLVVLEDEDPKRYFEYVNPDHILSMSFEGPVYEVVNHWPGYDSIRKRFDAIFEKYGLYYELGNTWNLSCYYI